MGRGYDTTPVTATAPDVLLGKVIVNSTGVVVTGTMPNRGAVSKALNCGESYTVPNGYHNGSGTVTANSLASQTSATATADKILSGETAWVNGTKITGTIPNRGAVSKALNCGESYTVPNGYHNGSGTVTANSLASQTSATATADKILSGETAWVNGTKITGTIPVYRASDEGETLIVKVGETYVLPSGYYEDNALIIENDKRDFITGTATVDDVLDTKTIAIDGELVTGTIPTIPMTSMASLRAGDSRNHPSGYYQNEFTISAISLEDQTQGTAVANDIISDKTAWVNGIMVTGTMPNRAAVNESLNCGESYTVPNGYHNGSGTITANSLSSQTIGTAAADKILSGETAWVNGEKIIGSLSYTEAIQKNEVLYDGLSGSSSEDLYNISNDSNVEGVFISVQAVVSGCDACQDRNQTRYYFIPKTRSIVDYICFLVSTDIVYRYIFFNIRIDITSSSMKAFIADHAGMDDMSGITINLTVTKLWELKSI